MVGQGRASSFGRPAPRVLVPVPRPPSATAGARTHPASTARYEVTAGERFNHLARLQPSSSLSLLLSRSLALEESEV